MDRLSDRALFSRAARDEAAFAVIVRRYREQLRRHAARFVGDADAEDVLQQALVNASLALRREPDRDIDPKPWLYRVTTNAAIDHQRAQAVRPLGDRPHEEIDVDAMAGLAEADPHDVVTGRESVRSVVSGIQGLAPNQKRAATARFLEGRSHDEIASELGVSKGAARELIHRARRNLREAIPVLSPVPLFAKLRESFAGLLAGSGTVGGAKLTAGAAAVIVAAGAGGVALTKAGEDGSSAASAGSPVTARPASVSTASSVPDRPRDGRRDATGGSRQNGGGDGGNGGGSANQAVSGSAATGSAAGAPSSGSTTSTTGESSAPASGGGPADQVQGLAEDIGVGDVTEELGVGETAQQLGVPGVDIGVDAPNLPDLPEANQVLGGGN